MNDKSNTMKNELRLISNYRALMISKYYLCISLVMSTLYMGIYRLPISPLYILLFLIILPPIFAFTLKDYAQKYNYKILNLATQELPFQLKNLKKKYHYSKINYVTNSVAYVIAMLLLCLWQISNRNIAYSNLLLDKLPLTILGTGLTLRFLAVIFYRIKLHYDLMHNKV